MKLKFLISLCYLYYKVNSFIIFQGKLVHILKSTKTDTIPWEYPNVSLTEAEKLRKIERPIDIIFIGGSLVNKEKYNPLIQDIKKKLSEKNIPNIIHIINSYKDVEDLKKKKILSNEYHIIGHSYGSYEGALICKNNEEALSLIQWCGNFNLQEQHPYPKISLDTINNPSLSILAELDERLPCTDALYDKELLSDKHKMIVLDNFTHFSGIDNNKENENILSDIISDYITYLELNDQSCKYNIKLLESKTHNKFKNYLQSLRNYTNNQIGEDIQKIILPDVKSVDIYPTDYSTGSNVIETILQVSSAYIELLLYLYKFFPSFVMSHPQLNNNMLKISTFRPPKINVLSYIKKNEITNPPIWLKLKKRENQINIGKKIGNELLKKILVKVSDTDKIYYNKKPIIFEDDITIGNHPFCSVQWLLTPISIQYNKNNIIIRCPVLQTTDNIPEYITKIFSKDISNSLNIKMLSESQMLEWILVKCKM